MVASSNAVPLEVDEHAQVLDLQEKLEKKSSEVVALEAKLDSARIATEELRGFLKIYGASERVVPTNLRTGGLTTDDMTSLRDLLSWLAAHVDTTRENGYSVGGEIDLGNEARAVLGKMACWPLSQSGEQKLSVPQELREEILGLLDGIHKRGDVCSDLDAQRLAVQWRIVQASMASPDGQTVPAIFLVNSVSDQACVVAAWPALSREPVNPRVSQPAFDPVSFFGQRPVDNGVAADKDEEAVSSSSRRAAVVAGGRVEVKWRGQWYSGIFKSVQDDGMAQVQCDVDTQDLITVAPLSDVRLPLLLATPIPDVWTSLQNGVTCYTPKA